MYETALPKHLERHEQNHYKITPLPTLYDKTNPFFLLLIILIINRREIGLSLTSTKIVYILAKQYVRCAEFIREFVIEQVAFISTAGVISNERQ